MSKFISQNKKIHEKNQGNVKILWFASSMFFIFSSVAKITMPHPLSLSNIENICAMLIMSKGLEILHGKETEIKHNPNS